MIRPYVLTDTNWKHLKDADIDPAAASKEKGERFFNAVCAKLGGLLVKIAAADIRGLYQ